MFGIRFGEELVSIFDGHERDTTSNKTFGDIQIRNWSNVVSVFESMGPYSISPQGKVFLSFNVINGDSVLSIIHTFHNFEDIVTSSG